MTEPTASGVPASPAATPVTVPADPYRPGLARGERGVLADLNDAEVLSGADVHVARRLAGLGGVTDPSVMLGAALAVRAARGGSVCVDLRRESELAGAGHGWPPVDRWREALAASSIVGHGTSASEPGTPLVLQGDLLYLARYWGQESQVREELVARARVPAPPAADAASLAAYFPEPGYEDQQAAVAAACGNWTSVITGGPGTGKTTTIARLLGVLFDGDPTLRVALAAPTGRAAARLAQAVREATAQSTFPAAHRERLASLDSTTLHRLLGWVPDQRSRFRHNRGNRLPFDVVVVDETSMVSLTMMARLLEALRPETRLVLVGDADQLASVDAGAVLGDLVDGLGAESGNVAQLGASRRFGQRIGALAAAIRDGDAEEALALLAAGTAEAAAGAADDLGRVELVSPEEVEELVLAHARRLREVAETGDAATALRALDEHRLLCAHREGPFGAQFWNRRVERLLAEQERRPGGLGTFYAGRPVIVTENDYGLDLFNGDVGVVVRDPEAPGGLRAAMASGDDPAGRPFAVARVGAVRSAHAMTVHRSQGSQVEEVTVLLPEADSRLLSRQLLYTAVTRARQRVRIAGSEDVLRAAIAATAQRASGLAARLRD